MLVNANIDVLVHLLCSASQCLMLANGHGSSIQNIHYTLTRLVFNPAFSAVWLLESYKKCSHSATPHIALTVPHTTVQQITRCGVKSISTVQYNATANNPIQSSEQCNHSATPHSATHHSATIRQEWSKKCNHSRSRNRQLWWRQVNRTLLSGLRATLVLLNPTLVNFYFWFGHCLGEPVKKDLLQFYFYPYIDYYDPTTPILYNVHTYV